MECKECQLKGYVAGQAFKEFICEKCGHTAIHHNTNIPKYCDSCSANYNICERCGRSLDENS